MKYIKKTAYEKLIDKMKYPTGTTRTIEKFLLFPKCINNEIRWFEKVKYKQEYIENWAGRGIGKPYIWNDMKWLD